MVCSGVFAFSEVGVGTAAAATNEEDELPNRQRTRIRQMEQKYRRRIEYLFFTKEHHLIFIL
ncbi:hypothetical protein J45TS6_12760 [Paenibacillus sp. J45TS6]|nr:hypothetical protein J45TS6_12760 [Paenibacillus sp. J45TS6]